MKAVILAAGEGKRFRRHSGENIPKPLTNLLGLPILERNITSLRKAGFTEVIIVTGHLGEKIKEFFQGRDLGLKLSYVENHQWQKGNGTSLYAARGILGTDEPFLLLMSDHYYQTEMIQEVISGAGTGNYIITLDPRLSEVFNLEDATKVCVDESGRPVSIGKELQDYNAIDCGLFILGPAIFKSLEASFMGGDYSLTGGVRKLAEGQELRSFFIKQHHWFDIDTPADLKNAEKKMLKGLAKETDGLISRRINRRVSVPISRRLVNYPISPYQVTIFSFLLAVASSVLFIVNLEVLGGIFAGLTSICDGIDGEIAKLKQKETRHGMFFDSFLDRIEDGIITAGVAIYCFNQWPSVWVLLLASLAIMGSSLSIISKDRFLICYNRLYIPGRYDGWRNYLLANRDGRLFIITLFGILRFPIAALIILAFTTNLLAVHRLSIAKKFSLPDQRS